MVLHLLQAADSVGGAHRKYLLQGAADLSDWLVQSAADDLTHTINRWQVDHRRRDLSPEALKEIRLVRRALEESDDRELRNACLTILLDDADELAVIIDSLSPSQLEVLQSWPIWGLTARAEISSRSPSGGLTQ